MPNKKTGGAAPYRKGQRKELKICKQLKEDGWDIAQRTAGSHSPIDIIAISKEKNMIRLIQSKPDNFGLGKAESIMRQNWWLNGRFLVEFFVE